MMNIRELFICVFLTLISSQTFAYQLSGEKWSTNTTKFYVDIQDKSQPWNDAF